MYWSLPIVTLLGAVSHLLALAETVIFAKIRIVSPSAKSVGSDDRFNCSHSLPPPPVGRFAVELFPLTPTVIVGGVTLSFTETVGAKVDTWDSVLDCARRPSRQSTTLFIKLAKDAEVEA